MGTTEAEDSTGSRLGPEPFQEINRQKKHYIDFEGKRIEAYEGDTVASALYAAGVRIFSRSFKYHRPRGLLCVSGNCPNCLMNVDGVPNVRACMEVVRGNLKVKHQNAWPSLTFDVLSVLDKIDMPVGFYYKTLHKPKLLWPVAERIIRRITGIGKIGGPSQLEAEHEYKYADIAVVGGGPAGLAAAAEAAKTGAKVILVDDQQRLGGHLRIQKKVYREAGEFSGLQGFEIAAELAKEVQKHRNAEVLLNSKALGFYEGSLLAVRRGHRLIKVRTQKLVVATGSYEQPLVFFNNDLPGVFLGSGLQRLIRLYGVKPGESAVVVSANDYGLTVACDLLDAGVAVRAVVEGRPSLDSAQEEVRRLRESGVPILPSHTVVAAKGKHRVEGVTAAELDSRGEVIPGTERHISCELISVSVGFEPAASLLHQAGGTLVYDEELGEVVPGEIPADVYVAGDVTGIHYLPATIVQGRLAGVRAALGLSSNSTGGYPAPQAGRLAEELHRLEEEYRRRFTRRPLVSAPVEGKKNFVCVCEDVTEKDVRDAIAEGFDEIETIKRYTTISMGPCQGKMCLRATRAVCSRETGRSITAVGTPTSRPPIQPTPLGVLAGKEYDPVRITSLHHEHEALKAPMVELSGWLRPHHYSTAEEEAQAIRERVGIIDIGTLGKLEVKGEDAAKLLDLVYTTEISSIKVGRTRYGVVCDENGVVINEGVVARLAEDHFLITCASGTDEFLERWIKLLAVGRGLCAHVVNVTGGVASINVAGPRSRELLSRITEADLSPEACPPNGCGVAEVAGVPALYLRTGFVGELGWELHFPAEYGEYMWRALMEAGKDLGVTPFGVDAQRILRLEKKHLIAVVDTDAITNPFEAELERFVKLEKPEFVGKHALLAIKKTGITRRLVGFVVEGDVIPQEGSVTVFDGRPFGRVTSSRFSPVLKRGIGFAWVPAGAAKEGYTFQISDGGKTIYAKVHHQPFYDPEGKRMRM